MRPLVVKLTVGAEQAERAVQALTVAATACAAGADVQLWLAGDAVLLAGPGADLAVPGAPPGEELLAQVLAAGAVHACSSCLARRGLTGDDLRPGVTVSGAAAFVERVLSPDVQALVY